MKNFFEHFNWNQLDPQMIEKCIVLALPFVWKLCSALLLFLVGKWCTRRVSRFLVRLMEKKGVDLTLVRFLDGIVYYTLLIAVLLAAASQLGITTTSFFAILGTASLAVGLALKDSLANFSAGVMLILFRPFKVGDYIEVAGEAGTVEYITVFNTILNTGDNQRKIVPNGAINNSAITNVSANPVRRIDLVIGIGYDDDIRKAKETLTEILAAEKRILPEPAPQVAVSELGHSSVDLVVRPWVKNEDYWTVKCTLTEQIKLVFDERGISFPYPQQDIHLFEQK